MDSASGRSAGFRALGSLRHCSFGDPRGSRGTTPESQGSLAVLIRPLSLAKGPRGASPPRPFHPGRPDAAAVALGDPRWTGGRAAKKKFPQSQPALVPTVVGPVATASRITRRRRKPVVRRRFPRTSGSHSADHNVSTLSLIRWRTRGPARSELCRLLSISAGGDAT
jgi:hypothetical protein